MVTPPQIIFNRSWILMIRHFSRALRAHYIPTTAPPFNNFRRAWTRPWLTRWLHSSLCWTFRPTTGALLEWAITTLLPPCNNIPVDDIDSGWKKRFLLGVRTTMVIMYCEQYPCVDKLYCNLQVYMWLVISWSLHEVTTKFPRVIQLPVVTRDWFLYCTVLTVK